MTGFTHELIETGVRGCGEDAPEHQAGAQQAEQHQRLVARRAQHRRQLRRRHGEVGEHPQRGGARHLVGAVHELDELSHHVRHGVGRKCEHPLRRGRVRKEALQHRARRARRLRPVPQLRNRTAKLNTRGAMFQARSKQRQSREPEVALVRTSKPLVSELTKYMGSE
jgi:hypothetical protein